MSDGPVIDTATWRLDYPDGSSPKLLIEVARDGSIWLKQGDQLIDLDREASIFAHDALLQAIRVAEKKGAQ